MRVCTSPRAAASRAPKRCHGEPRDGGAKHLDTTGRPRLGDPSAPKAPRLGVTPTVISAALAVILVMAGCAGGGVPSAIRRSFPSAVRVDLTAPPPGSQGVRAVHVAHDASGVIGYGVEQTVVSRSGPFVILVLISPDLRVREATILSYPGERGREVRSPAFTQQFVGKGLDDPLRLGQDIDAMTGATISSRAMTEGVRQAVRVVQLTAADRR